MQNFPIDSLKQKILSALSLKDFLIIKSTPGSGKTTRVPLFLKEHFKKKIYVLEPRKLAAKLASHYVASSLGEKAGESVGHIFKYERVASDLTQILFITEGTFLRFLSEDTNLENSDVVILDEFHERHYQTDVALSFLLKIKEANPSLKVIIMSATIDLSELQGLLKERVETIELNERRFDLKIEYLPNDTLLLKEPLERKVYTAFKSIENRIGHVLIFLPGMYEINLCADLLAKTNHQIVLLHGELSGVTIDESYEDLSKKKIILSTNIAESSVTIPGVRTVIDSGLHRTSRLNPITRLPLIELKKISQSSAIQRANRASREDHGLAIRLYSEFDYQGRQIFDPPEINRTDLSELILNSLLLYKTSVDELNFVTPLNQLELKNSKTYLEHIGLLENSVLTESGKRLAQTPFHPRIAKILDVAAMYGPSTFQKVSQQLAIIVEPKRMERFIALAKKHFKVLNGPNEEIEKCFLFGFIDQIAKLKNRDHLIHMNGETYSIAESLADTIDPRHPLWIILNVDNRNRVTNIMPIEEDWLFDLPHFPIEEEDEIDFDPHTFKLRQERVSRIGAIVLNREKILNGSITKHSEEVILKQLKNVLLEKCKEEKFLRIVFFEQFSSEKIENFSAEDWLRTQLPFLVHGGDYGWSELMESYSQEIFNFLNAEGTYDLETDLPLQLSLHDKRKVPLHYDLSNGVHCQSYIQDFFGLNDVPVVLKGKEKVKIHLLGPHKRPLQVTQDLPSFWSKTYKELYNELKRDYPRHYWPLEPQKAKPILLLKNVPTSDK